MHLVKLKQFDAYPRKIDPSRDYSSPASILSTRGGARIRGHLQTWPVEKGTELDTTEATQQQQQQRNVNDQELAKCQFTY